MAALTLLAVQVSAVLAGIGWDPQIRGILTVTVAVVILIGSIYLIVGTNTGARLGFLITGAGFFGWMVILTLYWTIIPPGIGPAGPNPKWHPVEIHYNLDSPPELESARTLPPPEELAAEVERLIEENPELAGDFDSSSTLSEIAASELATQNPDLLGSFGGWTVIPSSAAGEVQAAADAILLEEGIFGASSEYVKLDVLEFGGKPKRESDDVVDRVKHRIETTVWWKHPPHYAVVQVQPAIQQEARPGEPPPLPVADENEPVISIIFVRDLGNQRGLPLQYLVISTIFFIIFVLMLHFRDKTLEHNLAAAAATKASKAAGGRAKS